MTVLCIGRVGQAIRTEDVQERVLQAEELVAVGRHDGLWCSWWCWEGLGISNWGRRRDEKQIDVEEEEVNQTILYPARLDPRFLKGPTIEIT